MGVLSWGESVGDGARVAGGGVEFWVGVTVGSAVVGLGVGGTGLVWVAQAVIKAWAVWAIAVEIKDSGMRVGCEVGLGKLQPTSVIAHSIIAHLVPTRKMRPPLPPRLKPFPG